MAEQEKKSQVERPEQGQKPREVERDQGQIAKERPAAPAPVHNTQPAKGNAAQPAPTQTRRPGKARGPATQRPGPKPPTRAQHPPLAAEPSPSQATRLAWKRQRLSQSLKAFFARLLGRMLRLYRRDQFLFISVVLGLLLLLPLAYALIWPHLDGTAKKRIESLHSLRFAVERSEANEYYPLTDNTILHVGDQSLRLLNAAGVEIRRYDFPSEKSFVIIKDGLAFVGEQDGYRYIVLDEREKHYEGKTKEPIKGASLAQDGRLALILDQRSSFGLLRVLKADGSVNFDWLAQDREQSGFILNSLFSEQGDYLYVSLYNSSSYNGHAAICRMRLSGEQRGQIEQRYELPAAGPLLFMAEAERGGLYLADGQKLYKLAADGKLQDQSFGRLSAVLVQDGRCWALAEEPEQRSLALVSWDGRREAEVIGTERYTESARLESGLGSNFLLLHGRTASIYDSRRGQLLEQQSYESPLIRGYLGRHKEQILITEDQVFMERR